jgi:hypothetical protein
MTREKQLQALGYDGGAEEFNDVLREVFFAMFPAWAGPEDRLNDEELAREPREGLRYCEAVRCRTCEGLPDRLIIAALQALRKRPRQVEARAGG